MAARTKAAAPATETPEVAEGYTVLINPLNGAVTTVPDEIVDALIQSGYTRR